MVAGGPSLANHTTSTAIPWSRDEISSCNCAEKPFTHVHCNVGIAAERQCAGVQNFAIGGKLAFLPRVVSLRTNQKNQFVVQRTWIFSRQMASGMSYQVS